jgi:hypothetical protein
VVTVTSPDELREQIERALCDGGDEQFDVHVTHEDKARRVLAVVTPELERRDAEIARLESLALEKHGLFQGWRLAAMEDRRQKLALWAERDALRASLADALEGMQDMVGYVGDYFRDKWGHDEYIERAKTALAALPDPSRDSATSEASQEGDDAVIIDADDEEITFTLQGTREVRHG